MDIATSFFVGAYQGLERMAVQVKGVFAWIQVVEDNFDDLAFLEYEGVGVAAVDRGVHN